MPEPWWTLLWSSSTLLAAPGLWEIAAVLPLFLAVALAVNRLAPARRTRLRAATLFLVLYASGAVLELVLLRLTGGEGVGLVHVGDDLFLGLLLLQLAAISLFDLTLPTLGFSVAPIVHDVAVGFGFFVVVGIVLASAGIDVTSFLAGTTIVAAVLAVSLQGTLGNVVGGFALQLDGSVREGDWVQLENGRQGKLKAMRWRHTVFETRDGGSLVVPNALLLQTQLLVLGKREAEPLRHRMWVHFQVDYRHAPQRVTEVVIAALADCRIPEVAAEPPPDCICLDLAAVGRESYGLYAVRYWLTDLSRDEPTNSKVRARVFAALRRAQIPLARPAMMVFHAPRGEEHRVRDHEGHRSRALQGMERIELFEPLTQAERTSLSERLVPAPFIAGEVMTRQGAAANWLYLLVAGTGEVRVTIEGRDVAVARVEGPTVFGEMGLLTGEERQASVVALTDCECYRLDKVAFAQILHERPEVAAELSPLVAQRRVELESTRQGLDQTGRDDAMARETDRIVERIREFFGL
jgi:small-conductance mechanosensitive channel/CRP-like cAMP-binding protein